MKEGGLALSHPTTPVSYPKLPFCTSSANERNHANQKATEARGVQTSGGKEEGRHCDHNHIHNPDIQEVAIRTCHDEDDAANEVVNVTMGRA